MRTTLITFMIACTALMLSCVGDDRCENYTWDPDSKLCRGPTEETADSGQEVDVEEDGGEIDTGGGGEVTGLGEPCETAGDDCAGFVADYCMANGPPGTPTGTCSVQGCSASPDNCPPEYVCCMTPSADELPDVCITEDTFAQIGSFLCEN